VQFTVLYSLSSTCDKELTSSVNRFDIVTISVVKV